MTVLKPKSWGDGKKALRWKRVYLLPIVVMPIIAVSVFIGVIVRFDPLVAVDDIHCDANDPEWVRFFGYAGLPFLMSLPSLFLSIKSVMQVYKTNLHLHRANPESASGPEAMSSFSRSPRTMNFLLSGRAAAPTPSAGPKHYPSTSRKFLLPFANIHKTSTPGHVTVKPSSDHRSSAIFPHQDLNNSQDDANSSQVSIAFPTFATPGGQPARSEDEVRERPRSTATNPTVHVHSLHEEAHAVDTSLDEKAEAKDVLVTPRGSDSVDATVEQGWREDKFDCQSNSEFTKDVFLVEDPDDSYTARPISRRVSGASGRSFKPLWALLDDIDFPLEQVSLIEGHEEPYLICPPLLTQITIFSAFIVVQFLACLSTIIDVAKRRPTPSPMGTQHVALLLAAWGPVIVFGHLPAVRHNLWPWRRSDSS
ncbi:hypothetical protein CVT24_011617 [Panaeolus cyanescens]|uniref:Uncharacterized protein n=1 Tax=Panaeolus cyanescens TaxID=181874 RepID=A0A409YGZ2_9AGAR|nr:hypothetical protein CVT24_011617 [Panaeolus cyanescens]